MTSWETKLSKLQRWILKTAYAAICRAGTEEPQKRNWRVHNDDTYAHLLRVEVMRDYFGIPVHLITSFEGMGRYLSIDTKAANGKKTNAARVALARSLRRLEERGLIKEMAYSGSIVLTANGIEVAKSL